LRRKDAHPNLFHRLVCRPLSYKVSKIFRALEHRAGDGAMNGDMLALNVSPDLVVGRRLTALIVFGLQAVHRDANPKVRQRGPRWIDGPEGAGDNLNMYAEKGEFRQQNIQLAISHKGIATDDGKMKRLVFLHQRENIGNQLLAFEIGEAS
jgi:hypothetical protein